MKSLIATIKGEILYYLLLLSAGIILSMIVSPI